MFSIFKTNPVAKLNKQYSQILEQALVAQRKGDIRGYSELTAKAESLAKEIDALQAEQ